MLVQRFRDTACWWNGFRYGAFVVLIQRFEEVHGPHWTRAARINAGTLVGQRLSWESYDRRPSAEGASGSVLGNTHRIGRVAAGHELIAV